MITGGKFVPNTPPKYGAGDYVVWSYKNKKVVYIVLSFSKFDRCYSLKRVDIGLLLNLSQFEVESYMDTLTDEDKAGLL